MKLLAVVRLSRDSDETTSPERQLAAIQRYAAQDGHTVIGVAEDLDVSGGVSPFKRPQLGAWLQRPGEWDGLICSRLDRLSRSTLDFLELHRWLEERSKILIAIDVRIDMSTPMGRAFAQVGVVFAELELATIRARALDAYRVKQQSGTYPGGSVPFGYRAVPAEGKGWRFETDPEFAPVVAEMADRVLNGESLTGIARWLNEAGVPTSRNAQRRRAGKPVRKSGWTPHIVGKVLRSPAVAGMTPREGEPLPGPDGLPVQRCPGIITWQQWRQLRTVLAERATAGPGEPAPLVGIMACVCGGAMYQQGKTIGSKRYRYYQCGVMHADRKQCRARMVRAEIAEELLETALLDALGELPMLEKVLPPGPDTAEERDRITEAMSALEDEFVGGQVAAELFARVTKRLEIMLADLPAPSRPGWIETGETFSDWWAGKSWQDRRDSLRRYGVTVKAYRTDHPHPAGLRHYHPAGDERRYTVSAARAGTELLVYMGDLAKLKKRAAEG